MKKSLIILLFTLFFSSAVKAQIEKVIVETYYISDSLDATDTIDGSSRALAPGSKTYRVYIDLKKGYKLTKIYGDTANALKIASTLPFYNNIDRPEYYGYQIKSAYFKNNPTLALDSWLTLGLATTLTYGIPKTQDTGVSVINPNHSSTWGGTAGVSGGLLVNTDPAAGIPITTEDGLWPDNGLTLGQWGETGFKNIAGADTTIFGKDSIGTQFVSRGAFISQVNGVGGAIPDSNQVLVAQLTTKGNISFELNVDVQDSLGNTKHFVATATYSLSANTVLCPLLKYPPVCGCTDRSYLEFDSTFACGDVSACHTLKVFGCTDTMACNYNPGANVFLPNFCCYPGYCNDRDIALVCPNLSPYRLKQSNMSADIYPNPVQSTLSLQLISSVDDSPVSYLVYDAYGKIVIENNLGLIPGNSIIKADVTGLAPGLYLFRVSVAGITSVKKFIKN